MGEKTYDITVRKTLPGTPERIWSVWTDSEAYNVVHGCHETSIDFREGGKIDVRFYPDRDVGETFVIREIDAPRRLVFYWEGQEENEVTLELEPRGDETDAAITQCCADDPDWIANCLDGWAWILDSLDRWLRTGEGIANDAWSREYGTHAIVRREE